MNNPSHNASTSCFFARLPFTSVHGKLVSKVPQRAVHAGKIVQGRTACVNGFGDDVLDVAREFNQALVGDPFFRTKPPASLRGEMPALCKDSQT